MAKAETADKSDFKLVRWSSDVTIQDIKGVYKKQGWIVVTSGSSPLNYYVVMCNLNEDCYASKEASIETVREQLAGGMKRKAYDRLKKVTNSSGEELGRVLRIPLRTLARRKVFKPDESERILRVGTAFQKTLEVFGDLEKARRWFHSPKRALGGNTPLNYCDTEPGAEEVVNLLGRIEHGVFS